MAGDLALEIRDLRVRFPSPAGDVRAVDGVSLAVESGETLAVVGESGCGKSITALSVLGLVPSPPAKSSGEILFEGRNLLGLDESEMRSIRGNRISMVFQEPMTSLNPVLTIGDQIGESFAAHSQISRSEVRDKVIAILQLVRMPDAERRAGEYPHQMSGGMRQRVMIAMALTCRPKLLIADEPTTALDVTTQAQILGLMRDLQQTLGMAIIFITHDLGVVAQTARRVVVMYAGKKVEEAAVDDLFARPMHPYTVGLLNSMPRLSTARQRPDGWRQTRLQEIPGTVPRLSNLPQGCSFAPRCAFADDQCRAAVPPLTQKRAGQWAACWHSDRLANQPESVRSVS